MKNRCTTLLILFIGCFYFQKSNAQCNWQPIISDGFEYTTTIPDLIPGVTYQSTPQTFASHTGTYAMYMNFIDCNSGAGTCAGAKVYERTFAVCVNMPVRLSMWMTTTFNAPQSNIKIVIRDANGQKLDSTASILAPLNPTWTQYVSATVTSTTPTITFSMYTNIDGGNGNDLSVDDLKLEKCATVSSTRAVSVCANLDSLNLFSSLTNNPVTNGTWTGPSLLSNGYWGTYSVGVNTPGTYFYASTPYSAAVGCPSRIDTVVAIPSNNPVINLPQDTILCTNQFLSLNAGAGGITNYLWSTGATTSNIIASTTLSADTMINYSVIITNQAGCTGIDTVQISFVVCSGINEVDEEVSASIFPNPATNFIQLQWNTAFTFNFHFRLMDVQGKIVFDELITSPQQAFSIQQLRTGVYYYQLVQHQDVKASGKLMIQK